MDSAVSSSRSGTRDGALPSLPPAGKALLAIETVTRVPAAQSDRGGRCAGVRDSGVEPGGPEFDQGLATYSLSALW